MENVGKRTGTAEISITSSIQEIEERISGVEDTEEEIDLLIKENIKFNKFLTAELSFHG